MSADVIVKFVPGAVFEDQVDIQFRDNNFVQTRDVRMDELAMPVYFFGEVVVVLARGFEHNPGAIDQVVSSQVDLAKAALSHQSAHGVIANMREIFAFELIQQLLVAVRKFGFM